LSVGINMSFASLLRDAKRFDEAEKQFLKTIELEPTYVDAYIAVGSLYEDSGRNELAVAMYRKATSLESIPARRDSVLAEIDKRGTQGYWNKLLEFAVEESKRQHVAPITLAALYAHSGNKERAIQSLQLSYEQRSPRLTWINAQSTWDSLRSDPKFQEIIRKMQFPKPQATKPLN